MLAPSFDNLELDNDAKLVESLEQRFTKQSKQKIKRNGIVSDLFDKEILSSLEIIFNNGRIGHQTLTILEFKQAIIQYIPENLVENICRSIDVNDTGFVNYSDFVNYMITSEQGTSFSNRTNASKFFLQCQQDQDTSVIHRDFIDSICYTKKPYPIVITGSCYTYMHIIYVYIYVDYYIYIHMYIIYNVIQNNLIQCLLLLQVEEMDKYPSGN